MANASFSGRLKQGRTLLLDGPMGTELHRLGVDTRLPLWSAWGLIEAPDRVRDVHRDYVEAGADVLTTNTFRTHRRSLAVAGHGDRAAELTALAVELARAAADEADRRVLVAGSVAPLEDCFSPELTPDDDALRREHEEHVGHLEGAGVDLLLVETMPTAREAVAAARAATATGLPVLVGFTCDSRGRVLSGESVAAAAAAVQELGPEGLLINCTPTHALHRALERLAAATDLPVGAYGNVGHSEDEHGWTATEAIDADGYVGHARRWIRLGARIVGSCCGTTPAYIAALRRAIDET